MKFAHIFIDRPIFATVLSLIVTILGGISLIQLPIAQYPEVTPPTVVVSTSYPGATPEVIAETVATPLEQEVNGVEGMIYMDSQSTTDGSMTLTITFELGTDLDVAQVLVQNRVAIAEPRLPEEVRRIGVTTRKQSPDLMLVAHMISPDKTFDQLYISNYVFRNLRDELSRIKGVGDVQIFGAREYSMRIWLDTPKLTELGMTTGDVVAALRAQNVQVAAGVVGQPPYGEIEPEPFQLPVNTLGRLETPEQFEEVVVRTGEDGRLVRVRDVGRVQLGARDYSINSYLGTNPAVAMVFFQQPGSNALSTAEEIQAQLAELSEAFPSGLEYRIVYNPTEYVEESILAVTETFRDAILLVVAVVLIFLQSWRAAAVPLAAIPVSLIGTFAIMLGLGYSLNNLSLFGLVLAIGIVVDDAIVVVENVERNIEDGLDPKAATHKAMDEVSGALIATSLVLIAVFVPTAFIPGISGQFYRQFAVTISASTAISTFVSLTLSPALCGWLLKSKDAKRDILDWIWFLSLGWFFKIFNFGFNQSSKVYLFGVKWAMRLSLIVLVIYGGLIYLTAKEFSSVPSGFIPEQDQGYLICSIQLPDGASLARTDAVTRDVVARGLEVEGVRNAVPFVGFSGATRTNASNVAAVFFPMEPFEERIPQGRTADAVLQDLRMTLSQVREAMVVVIPPPPVRGLGTGGGFKMYVQDKTGRGFDTLSRSTYQLVGQANAQPGLVQVFSTFRGNTPQLYADIDRTRAQMLDVPMGNVFETLQVSLGSLYINDFNYLGRVYRVTAQADLQFRNEPEDIARLKTRNRFGEPVPLGSVADIEETGGPDRVIRYQLYPAADINGFTMPGFSTGQSIETMEALAGEMLPEGIEYAWTDIAYQEKISNEAVTIDLRAWVKQNAPWMAEILGIELPPVVIQFRLAEAIFAMSVLFVFLALAALYESWTLPLAVILIVPLCLLSGITGVDYRGMDNNILTQIGFVVLVGLAAKNAILIVEFAKAEQERGLGRFEAAMNACRLRLRPILMTSLAFILGVVPLVIATGPGAEMRQALGTAVFSGMLGVTFFGLVFTPVFYVVIRQLVERRPKKEKNPNGKKSSPEPSPPATASEPATKPGAEKAEAN